MMLHDDKGSIWDQTIDKQFPNLPFDKLVEHIEFKFKSTGKKIDAMTAEYLVTLMQGHPKRTQQLAYNVWINSNHIIILDQSYLSLIKDNDFFSQRIESMLDSNDSSSNEAKTLFIVASNKNTGSRTVARQYGLTNENTTRRSLQRLYRQGLLFKERNNWKIADPLFAAWLRSNDPLDN